MLRNAFMLMKVKLQNFVSAEDAFGVFRFGEAPDINTEIGSQHQCVKDMKPWIMLLALNGIKKNCPLFHFSLQHEPIDVYKQNFT